MFDFGLPHTALVSVLICATSAYAASPASGRSVFLNGIDISSAKSQDLKHVDIHISENGDLFVIAPHYQVNEEDTYIPLSKYVQGLNQPAHHAPQSIEAGRTRELPNEALSSGQLQPKAGEVPPSVAQMQSKPAVAAAPIAASALALKAVDGTKAAVPPATAGEDQAVPLDPAVPPAAAKAATPPDAATKEVPVVP